VIKINCDLCGKVDDTLNRALVEGVELNVCSNCSAFGKVLSPIKKVVKQSLRKEKLKDKEEKFELLVEDYADILKKKRELLRLTQKEFAKKINEKESIIHKIETGAFEPSLELARKLEKMLEVKLIEEHFEIHGISKKVKEGGFTFGDFIKIKNKSISEK